MANRRPQTGNNRRPDFGRNDRGSNFNRSTVSPWQGGGPGSSLPSLLPLAAGSTEATLALASNIINLLQPRQHAVPSLLDMPIRRDFGPDLSRYNRGFGGPNKMGNQGNFRRTGTYPRSGDRMGNRRPNRPNDGPRQQYKSSPKKDSDSKAKPVKESSDKKDADAEKGEKEEGTEDKKNRFNDIDPKLLVCHICNKSMWDGRSFENHLNGRAHAIMMQKTAESYALTADTMRQEFKIREMKRTRKAGKQTPRDFYCAMCDLYAADGPEHRTTIGHRKLKKYLHPPCISCHKEMPTRIELDEHRLTPEHMRKIQGNPQQMQPEMMQIYTLSMEQSFIRENQRRSHYGEKKEEGTEKKEEGPENKGSENVKEEDDQAEKKDTENATEEKSEEKTETSEEKIDAENTVVDFKEGDDMAGLSADMLPVYSAKRGVGKSFLSEFRCVQCKLCNKLLDSDETAEVHLRTWRHHRLFTRMLMKNLEPEHPEQEKPEPEKNEKDSEATKRALPTEESGNWKRRKTTTSENDDDQNGHDVDIKDEENVDEDGDQEMPSADNTVADNTQIEEQAEEANGAEDVVEIKKEKDDDVEEVEIVEVKQEVKESPTKGKPAPRGRGRGRRRN